MGALRQRKLDARARRQESLHNQGAVTAEKTIPVQVPQPKNLMKKEPVKVVAEVKRGRGRPPKSGLATSKKTVAGSKMKRPISKKGKK